MFRDKTYITTLLKIALPIILQNFVMSSLNMVDVMMIGQLDETAVAAVGLANQVYFLMALLLFGVGSGAAIFTAQYWGVSDIPNIRKTLGIGLGMAVLAGLIFTVIALVFPKGAMSLYSEDLAVIETGTSYLRIVGFSYLATALTTVYSFNLRSVERVRLPMVISICALLLNTFLNYSLILGHFGFPALGVRGAAIGTCISRLLECVLIVGSVYLARTPLAARISELTTAIDPIFFKRVLKTTMPVVLNEVFWSFGITVYNMVYARVGTAAVAAVNIGSTIQSLAYVLFIGIASATAIMIGNSIGAGDEKRAYTYAKNSLILTIGGGIVIGAFMAVSTTPLLRVYNISPLAAKYAYDVMMVFSFVLFIRVTNLLLIAGIFRSGGDTRFAMFLDAGMVWVVGVPMALLSAFVFKLPIHWVVLCVMSEELIKVVIGIWRMFSRRWINNLVDAPTI